MKIKSIKKVEKAHTWDYSVPEAEHYILSNGVVSHNSTSIIMGNTSPSIEPFRANCFRQDTTSGSHFTKNKNLDALIREESKKHDFGWYDEQWNSILSNRGSVQHLEWLSDHDKEVYKTAFEIDQRWLVQHAADRQKYIDQAQSLNVFFYPDTNLSYLHHVHYLAWKLGLKTLYYCRSEKIKNVNTVATQQNNAPAPVINNNADDIGCLACE